MNELVFVEKEKIFTTSIIIAEGTGNKRNSIQAIIDKYFADIEEFGELAFEFVNVNHSDYRGGTHTKVYYLNEEQATFVLTLLRNSKTVVKFKKELVKQFYAMRNYIREHNSESFQQARLENKQNRLKETDVIKQLVEYAKEQGSTHSDKLYMTYTKLAKTVVDGSRDKLNIKEIGALTLVESIILQTIRIDMDMNMNYKDIYKDCKQRIDNFKHAIYIQENNLLSD